MKKLKGWCGQSCLCLRRGGVSRKVFKVAGGGRAHLGCDARGLPGLPTGQSAAPPETSGQGLQGCRMTAGLGGGHPCVQPLLVHRSEGLLDSCSQGLDRSCTVSPGVLRGIEPRLKDFHQLLLSPPKVGVLSRSDLVGGVAGEARTSWVACSGGHTQAPSAECPSSLTGGLRVERFTVPQMTPVF